MYTVLMLTEAVLTAAVTVLLVFLPVSSILAVLFLISALALLVWKRPALRISRKIHAKKRYVLRRGKVKRMNFEYLQLSALPPPACVSRLLEASGKLKPAQGKTAALLSTLLDLNCRGFLEIQTDEEGTVTVILNREQAGREQLLGFEKTLLDTVGRMMRPAHSARIAFLVEYAARHCFALQRRADRFARQVDRYLLQQGYLTHTLHRTAKRSGRHARIARRYLTFTPKGLHTLSLLQANLTRLCHHPDLQSYPDALPGFEKELERALILGASGGAFRTAREELLREFLFAPQSIWNERQYFYRVAYSDDSVYSVLQNVLYNIVCYGTPLYREENWAAQLAQVQEA